MKKGILLLFTIAVSYAAQSQTVKRQTVYSLVKQKQTIDWYKEQATLWKSYLDKNENDAAGWLNYYMANRMLKIYGAGVTPDELDSLVNNVILKKIPNTFEGHYIAYYNSGLRDAEEDKKHLQKAQELGPNREELFDDLLTYYEINRDHKNIKSIAEKWYASNDISSGIYTFCYNMLQSVEDNAILFTFGDNDTYPAWILQQVKGVKPKVTVLNLSLMMHDAYREAYFKELGIAEFGSISWENLKSYQALQDSLIHHVKKHSNRPIYFATSGNINVFEEFKSDVHNVGLAYKWCDYKFDNIAVIKKNVEKYFLVDYLKIQLQNDISQGVIDENNTNYLIPFITLYNHYKESEDSKAIEMKNIILQIAERANKMEEVLKLL